MSHFLRLDIPFSLNALKLRAIIQTFETKKKVAWWIDTKPHLNMSSLSNQFGGEN